MALVWDVSSRAWSVTMRLGSGDRVVGAISEWRKNGGIGSGNKCIFVVQMSKWRETKKSREGRDEHKKNLREREASKLGSFSVKVQIDGWRWVRCSSVVKSGTWIYFWWIKRELTSIILSHEMISCWNSWEKKKYFFSKSLTLVFNMLLFRIVTAGF